MQVMPATAEFVLEKHKYAGRTDVDLSNPLHNIRIAVWYIEQLHKSFEGDLENMLMAYNLGPTKLKRYLPEGNVPQPVIAYAEQVLENRNSLYRGYVAFKAESSVRGV